MFKKLILLLLISPSISVAQDSSGPREIFFHLGTHTEFYRAIQINDSGRLRKFDLAPTFGMGTSFLVKEKWALMPEVNWVLPQTSENSKIITNTFMFRGDLGYQILEWLRLRAGTSIVWLNQHGRGGEAQMNNGNTTSTFYYPDENRSSLNNTLDLGVEAFFKDYSIRLQTYTYSILKQEQRQLSYTIFFTYYWKK